MAGQLIKIVGLTFAAIMLFGCTVQQPISKVTAVEITERSPIGVRMLVSVDIENPNQIALPVTNIQYSVSLQDAGTFNFTELGDITLSAGGKQSVTLPAAFALPEDATLNGKKYTVNGQFFYRPPGELRALLDQYHLPLPISPFTASGNVEQ
ncbi:hypothetical protein JD969_19575 [Planctomycetota bacterium]|nr:hypothetical protein JD969_19575 [Planctomycetota bacterium]